MSYPPAARAVLTLLALGLIGGCADREPAGPTGGMGELQIHAAVNSPTVSTLVVKVTAADLSDPLVFNFELGDDGVAGGRIVVPAGADRTIEVRAYDVGGIQTHEGQATVDIRRGPNPTVHITLRPLTGDQEIEIVLGSFTVTIQPSEATLAVGQTLQLEAMVTDVDGSVVAGTGDVVWATDRPAVATVDAAGLVSAHLEGSARIVASFGGVAAAAQITVSGAAAGTEKIAFVSGRDGNSEIYVMNADGTGQTNLTNNPAADFNPDWSPDGSKLTFVSSRDGNDEVYMMNADGTGPVRLTTHAATDHSPAWSPDGLKIAFASNRAGNFEIHVMNADGSGVINLTNNAAFDFDPTWSPDGSKIAFVSGRDGNFEIYVMNADGSGVINLTNTAGDEFELAWSPDARLVFTGRPDNSSATPTDVFVMNADGTGRVNVTNNPALDGTPDWSPDGTRIAFQTRRDGNAEIYVMNADGTGAIRLTNDPALDLDPSWGRIP